MPTHNDPYSAGGAAPDAGPRPEQAYHKDEKALHSIGEGYEITDVSVSGVNVFLAALGVTLLIFFVFAFGMGKVMNTVMRHNDGPPNPWQQAGGTAAGGNTQGGIRNKSMESNTAMEQQQLHQMVQAFPTPRLQTDDGDQDLTDLHAREDLLLTHYTYVDSSQGKIRIPIDQAMLLIAQRGLAVAPAPTGQTARMYGDTPPSVQVPLTSGFARTGYEQERNSATGLPGDQSSAKANDY